MGARCVAGCRDRREKHARRCVQRHVSRRDPASPGSASHGCARRPATPSRRCSAFHRPALPHRRLLPAPNSRRNCHRQSPHRCGSDPDRRCVPSRYSCARLRNCPSAHRAAPRRRRASVPACVDSRRAGAASSARSPARSHCVRFRRDGPSHRGSAAGSVWVSPRFSNPGQSMRKPMLTEAIARRRPNGSRGFDQPT